MGCRWGDTERVSDEGGVSDGDRFVVVMGDGAA